MAKTKISEYDSTAANNTDINSINIAEGCAPSGINNAIREMMAQLKNFQTGTSGDAFTVGGGINTDTISEKTAAAGVTIDGVVLKDNGITASGTINFAGATITNAGSITSIDINGGTMDGVAVGAASPSTGAFTTLSSSSTTTLNGTTIPASATLTKTTDKLSVFAATTSAELAGVISDETGSGALVFGTNPTISGATVSGGTINNTPIGGTTRAAGNFTTLNANGNVTLGDANTDTITATGRFNTDLVPSTDNARDLGTSALKWKQIYATTLTEGTSPVVIQSDVGTAPNEVPLNQYLGSMAYKDAIGVIAHLNPAPTIASAATIQPVTPVVFVSGTTNIDTITAPAEFIGGGQITLIPTGLWSTTTSGNIALATTAVVSKAVIMTYDATTAKWYPSY